MRRNMSHESASKLNVLAEIGEEVSADINGDVTRELLPRGDVTTVGLSVRRVDAQSLPPIDTSLHIHDVSDGSNGRAPSTALTINKSHKLVNIGFSDLSYTVKTGIWKRKNKTIINGLNGEFKSGELTAMMGPSGAGKSTLMDILAGYTTKNVHGDVTVNGRIRDLKRFRRQVAYIMQDHELQPSITVLEAMHFSANLKVGSEMSPLDKKNRIKQILEAIGLYECRKTRSGKLSGGQKKRLAIALEIFDNPPVMFFDEPTSGLDSSTSTQVVSLLKKLALEGRTIISTIHQPSAIVLGMFDHLYAVAEGKCIFTGATHSLIPFLSDLDLVCPESYNPSDYLLEISTHDYGLQNDRLIEKTLNGKETIFRKQNLQQNTAQTYAMERADKLTAAGLITPVRAPRLPQFGRSPLPPLIETPSDPPTNTTSKRKKKISLQIDTSKWCQENETYATSFCRQLSLLLMRTFLILWRDRSLTVMRLLIHLCVATLIGTIYVGIGNDATNAFNNFRYIFFSIMFLMFTAFSSMTLAFPLELPIVTREHFNRWYSLKAYYVAMTLADAPIQTGCILIYIVITYLMTSQPLEYFRLGLFFAIILLTAFVAQSLGLVVGALFSVKNGAIFGPFFICPFLIFSGFFIHFSDAHPIMHWLFHISFLKYALEGASLAIFGYDRPKMICDQLFCQFVLPKKFMQTIDMHNGDYMTATIALFIIFLLFRFTAFFVMSFRLRSKR